MRFSQEVAEDGALIMEDRGAGSEIGTFTGDQYEGRFTGNVIDLCPVGALTSIPYRFVARPWDISNAPSVCGHCPVGCNVELTEREGHVSRVTGRPDPNYEVEEGWLCDKGRFAYPGDWAPDRLSTPVIRDGGRARDVALEEAVEAAALVLGRGRHGSACCSAPARRSRRASWPRSWRPAPLPRRAGAAPGHPRRRPRRPARAAGRRSSRTSTAPSLVLIVGGDPANQQPVVELRVRKARRGGAAGGLGRPAPARARGARRRHPHRAGRPAPRPSRRPSCPRRSRSWCCGTRPTWPPSRTPPTRWPALADGLGARCLELGADVNGAGLRALGIPASGVLEAAAAGEIDTLLTVHADPTDGAGASEWGWALGRVRARVAIASPRLRR